MPGIDLSSMISAGIGATAALGGVFIAQRSERKKAHADRIWAHRLEVYRAVYDWADAADRDIFGEHPDKPSREPKPLDKTYQIDLKFYGSYIINRLYDVARHGIPTAAEWNQFERDDQFAAMREVKELFDGLKQGILDEISKEQPLSRHTRVYILKSNIRLEKVRSNLNRTHLYRQDDGTASDGHG
jgi:hypothetical protein